MTADKRVLMEISARNVRGVEELLTTGGPSVDGSIGLDMSPVALAANQGQVDMIELPHGKGANLEASAPSNLFDEAGDMVIKQGCWPLHGAIAGWQVAALHALLKAGANPNGTDAEGILPR